MKPQIRNIRRCAFAVLVVLGGLVRPATFGPNVSRADDALRYDATAHVIAAFAQGRGIHGGEVQWGETTLIDGAMVGTWSIVSRQDGEILAVGATIPLSLADNQPQERGTGPAGAIASLEFPAIVQENTYFNHLEIQTEPQGHVAPPGAVNPDRNRVPHFDYHFYAIPEAQVWDIPLQFPPLPPVPAERLPEGYTQPGFSQLQMGRHSGPAWQLTDPNPLSTIMIAGYLPDTSQMHFLEPMISREFLLRAEDFTLPVPTPQVFDRDTLYPTRFEAVFHSGAHYFIFSDLIDTNPATAAGEDGLGLGLAVPEPGALSLLGLALPLLLRQRARHRSVEGAKTQAA